MKFFYLKMEEAFISEHLEPISKVNPIITHFYADDVMIFLVATTTNATIMKYIFTKLVDTVGFNINQAKSKAFSVKIQQT